MLFPEPHIQHQPPLVFSVSRCEGAGGEGTALEEYSGSHESTCVRIFSVHRALEKAMSLTTLLSVLILFKIKQPNIGSDINVAQTFFDTTEGRAQKNKIEQCKTLTIPACVCTGPSYNWIEVGKKHLAPKIRMMRLRDTRQLTPNLTLGLEAKTATDHLQCFWDLLRYPVVGYDNFEH